MHQIVIDIVNQCPTLGHIIDNLSTDDTDILFGLMHW